jgi:hypothetical protein
METKFQSMLDNYTNGNLSAFRVALKKLDKELLLRFVNYGLDTEQISPKDVLKQYLV